MISIYVELPWFLFKENFHDFYLCKTSMISIYVKLPWFFIMEKIADGKQQFFSQWLTKWLNKITALK